MNLLFLLFQSSCWLCAFFIMHSKNPVFSVFYLMLVFLNGSGLLSLMGMEYFQLLQLLVYVGQLTIMFLFVVMLLNIPQTEILAHQRGSYAIAGVLLLSLIVVIWTFLWQPDLSSNQSNPFLITLTSESDGWLAKPGPAGEAGKSFNQFWQPDWNTLNLSTSSVGQLAVALYGVHVDLLVMQSILLLIAMVGAVQLTLKRRAAAPVHDVFVQHSVDFQKVVYKLKSLERWLAKPGRLLELQLKELYLKGVKDLSFTSRTVRYLFDRTRA